MDITELDKNFAAVKVGKDGKKRFALPCAPFKLYGGMYEAGVGFVRMPQKIAASVSEGVHFLSTNGAGLRLNFTTNSKTLRLYVRESYFCRMRHMALTGSTGFILCSREGAEKKSVLRGVLCPEWNFGDEFEVAVNLDGELRDYILHFPLYSSVASLAIELDGDAYLGEGTGYKDVPPVLYYGSSITQGGCASRADNSYEDLICERTGVDYINLGFSGNGKAEDNYFKTLGFDYRYVADGNDVEALIAVLNEVKDSVRPVVVHVHTLKGKGYAPAEEHKEQFHWSLPFDLKTGQVTVNGGGKSYGEYVADYLEEQAVRNDKLAVINAATPGALMLRNFREKHPEKYFDVGIAEEHAVAFTSALAKGGMQPVALFFGGFIQRAYDQLSQDLCLNNSPAVLVIENCGITGMDATHLSIFDIPLMSNIPNLVYLAPSTVEELRRMLDWAMAQKDFPVALRTPATMPRNLQYAPKQPLELNKFEITKQGGKVALIGLGGMLALAEDVAGKLAEKGIEATIVNPRFITGLDEELLSGLVRNHDVVVTLEDGVVSGGFGEKIARFYGDKAVKVYNFGAAKEFTDRVPAEELYRRYELTPEQIVKKILPLDNA